MKTIDERQMQKITKGKQRKAERSNGNRSYSERVRTKWFCCAFKLGFLQLIYKGSLIFKSNLELALSIILKQRKLYESQHVSEECRCLKIWDSFFSMYSFHVSIIEISHFKHIINRPIQDFSETLRVLHHFHLRLV